MLSRSKNQDKSKGAENYNKINNKCLCGKIPNKICDDPDSIYCSTICARADALAALTAPEDVTYTRASHYRRVSSKQELKNPKPFDDDEDNLNDKAQQPISRQSHWRKARQLLFGSPGLSDDSNDDEKHLNQRILKRKSKSYSVLNPLKQNQQQQPLQKPSLGQPKLKLKPTPKKLDLENKELKDEEEIKPPPLPPKPLKLPSKPRHKRVPAIIKIPGKDIDDVCVHSRNGSEASEAQTTASSATTTTTFATDTSITTAPSSISPTILDQPIDIDGRSKRENSSISNNRKSRFSEESLTSRITYQESPNATPVPNQSDNKPLLTSPPSPPSAPLISFNDITNQEISSDNMVRSSSSNSVALNRARSKAIRDRQKRLSLARSSNNLLQVSSNQSLAKTLNPSHSCQTFKSATTSTSHQTFESAFDGTNPADYSPSPTWEYDDIYMANSNSNAQLEPLREAPAHESPPLVDYDLNYFINNSNSTNSFVKFNSNLKYHHNQSQGKDTTHIKDQHESQESQDDNNIISENNNSDRINNVNDNDNYNNDLNDLDDSMKQALLMADDAFAFS